MNKYLSIFRTSFRQESKTLGNSITSVVSFAVIIYIFKELWYFIYGGGGGTLINGYTLDMMIWYMIMAEILMYALNGRATTKAFANDIKSGKIAYQLNKPYNYYTYQIATQSGVSCWKLCFLLPTAVLMGLILVGPIANFKVYYIFPILLSLALGILLLCAVYGIVGLLAFWIEESTPFTWIIQKFIMLFGLFFPPEFFPKGIQFFINYSPIYSMMSGPCKLLANFSWDLFTKVAISQVAYLTLFVVLGLIVYKIGTKKVNMHGG